MGEGQWVEKGRRGLLATVLLLGMPVLAEPEATVDTPKPEANAAEPMSEGGEGATAEPAGEKSGEKAEEKKGPQVRAFGRVYARVSADERDDYERALSIPSARVGVAASLSRVDAEVTADLASKNILKDAFVRVSDKNKQLRLYGGQFKAPFLARELASSWQLPLMERGLVADYLEDTHQMGGRRLGLMGEVSLKEAWKLKVSGGVFQGAKDEELDRRTGEDAALRVSVRPFKALTVGASSYLAQVFDGIRNYAVATDATLHLGGLELSGEYVNGSLPTGPFSAQLGLASYTLPVSLEGLEGLAVQPVVGAEMLQIRGPLPARGYGFVGGLNVLYSEHFKAMFQAEHALRAGDEAPGFEYSLQLATRF